MARRKVKNGEKSRSLLFFVSYFSARLDFPSSPLSAPGSPRMHRVFLRFSVVSISFFCGTPTVKIRFGCTQNCKASQQDCVKSLSIISSSKSTNGIVRNLYRFLIDLLPLKNVSERFIVRTNCKASQQDCLKSLSIISSSKPTNQTVQNLYRFLIDLLPLKNVEIRTFLAKFVALEFSHSCF